MVASFDTGTRNDPRLGTLPRPKALSIGEERYALKRTTALPVRVDRSEIILDLIQYCWDADDQDGLGACASYAACHGSEVMGNKARGSNTSTRLHRLGLYEHVRKLRNWFPGDTGSYIADNLDAILNGGPLESAEPYVFSASFEYHPGIWAGAETRDYIKSHRHFYPGEGQFTENVIACLKEGMVVDLGSYWPGGFFAPGPNGTIEPGIGFDPNRDGGHSYLAVGRIPPYFVCPNSWSPFWNPQVAQAWGNFGVKPGWMLIHESYFDAPWQSNVFFEARALSAEVVVIPEPGPGPGPEPEPQPEPEPERSCRDEALGRVAPIQNELTQKKLANPRSTTLKFQLQGVEMVRKALQNL